MNFKTNNAKAFSPAKVKGCSLLLDCYFESFKNQSISCEFTSFGKPTLDPKTCYYDFSTDTIGDEFTIASIYLRIRIY